MVLVVAAADLGELRLRANALGLQALHERVAHDVRQLVDALLGRRRVHLLLAGLGVVHRALSGDELAGQLREARILDVEPIGFRAEDAGLALIRRQLLLRLLERGPQLRHLALEPARLAARRIDLQLETRLDVRIGKRVGELRGRQRIRRRVVDVDDAALARRPHVDLPQQLIGEPVAHRARAAGRHVELLAHFDELREPHLVDDFERDVVTGDHVDLGRHVTRQQRHRHQRAGHGIRALRIDDQRHRRHVTRRQQERDGEPGHHRGERHAEHQPAARAQNARESGRSFMRSAFRRDFP